MGTLESNTASPLGRLGEEEDASPPPPTPSVHEGLGAPALGGQESRGGMCQNGGGSGGCVYRGSNRQTEW